MYQFSYCCLQKSPKSNESVLASIKFKGKKPKTGPSRHTAWGLERADF